MKNILFLENVFQTCIPFGSNREFNRYLHDTGSRLLFKLRSRTHDLNEELGRHRGQFGKTVLYVVLSVRVWFMHCGSVQLIKIVGMHLSLGILKGLLMV